MHADELGPSIALRDTGHLRELPGLKVRRADVAHLPALNEVVQRLHSLLGWRHGVPEVDLEDVYVGRAEAGERRIDLVEEGGAREPALVHVLAGVHEMERSRATGDDRRVLGDYEESLRHNDDLLPGDIVLRIA